MKTLLFALLAGGIVLSATAAEAQFAGRDPMAVFDQADTNHDGVVSRAEYRAARLARFDRLDRNHDGVISRDDFKRLIRFRPQAGQMLDALLAEADANHDGRVTRAELAQAPEPLFDRADTNHDGVVDRAELAAARQRMQQLRQQAKR